MSINQLDKVDVISTDEDNNVVLTVSDHLKWSEKDHLLLLQDKLNVYLEFIETKQLLESYPNAKNKTIIISIAMKYKPNKIALDFLELCKIDIEKAGYNFEWKVLKD